MQLSELLSAMESIAPLRYAESWDNVGLLAGDPLQQVTKVLLTIDYTPTVAAEGRDAGCDAVIAYHPPIFHAIKRIPAGSVVYDAIRRGVAIYSPHTALDVADGGTNDLLADAIGMVDRRPLRIAPAKATQCKLVVFVPEKDAERLSAALFEAGAGRIGNYSSCSFRAPGTATFLGEAGSKPTIGQAGRLEQVPEIRLEMVVALDRVGAVVRALVENHPYEEPAFDLVQLAGRPEAMGQGRIGTIPAGVTREMLYENLKRALGIDHLLVAGPKQAVVHRAAVSAGACGDLLDDALAQRVDVFVTGEMRHHEALRAVAAGMTVVCTLHSNSERATLSRVAQRLSAALPGLEVLVSTADRDPFTVG